MVVRTNVFAINAHRNLKNTGLNQSRAAQRLSSGYRINSAADDAAGLAISESMRAQIRGLDQASVNAQDAVGLVQTAEGAMSTISEMVIRVRELVVKAANDIHTVGNREMIQNEIDQIMQEINDVTFRTQFNTRTLLAGGLDGSGGGKVSPVSLQWMIFSQAKHIGIASPSGSLTNNRTQHSIRSQFEALQDEWTELRDQIFDRHPPITTPLIDLSNITANNHELRQMENIVGRLTRLLKNGQDAFNEIISITNDQINALGGIGSGVFVDNIVNDWNAYLVGPHGPISEPRNIQDYVSFALDSLNDIIDIFNNADNNAAGLGKINIMGAFLMTSTFIENALDSFENVLDRSMAVLSIANLEANAMWMQIGANANQGLILQLKGVHTGILGGGRGDLALLIDVREESGIPISKQLDYLDYASDIVNAQRAQLGAIQNRLDFTRQSLDNSSENLSAAESRIRDANMAREMMRFTSSQVLQQAGISMLAQANQLPSSILQLLQ